MIAGKICCEWVAVEDRWNDPARKISNTRRKPCPSGNRSTKLKHWKGKQNKTTQYVIQTVAYSDEALIEEDKTASRI
jgi:hypothetical protein